MGTNSNLAPAGYKFEAGTEGQWHEYHSSNQVLTKITEYGNITEEKERVTTAAAATNKTAGRIEKGPEPPITPVRRTINAAGTMSTEETATEDLEEEGGARSRTKDIGEIIEEMTDRARRRANLSEKMRTKKERVLIRGQKKTAGGVDISERKMKMTATLATGTRKKKTDTTATTGEKITTGTKETTEEEPGDKRR